MLISGYTDLTYAMKPEESLPPDIMARGSCSAGGVCVAVGPALGGADGQKGHEQCARDEQAQHLCLHGGSALSFLASCSRCYSSVWIILCAMAHEYVCIRAFSEAAQGKRMCVETDGTLPSAGRLRVIVPEQRPVVRAHAVGARSEVPCGFPGLAPLSSFENAACRPLCGGFFGDGFP